jgi:hypothetical protein
MIMSSGLRKLALTAHIIASAGLTGAIACFLALAIAGLAGAEGQLARAAFPSMDLTARLIILPLALASLLTGLALSLGTSWGLVRYYWVLVKLVLTVVATAVLTLQLPLIGRMATIAGAASRLGPDLDESRLSLAIHAAGGLAVVLFAMVLSVYKPRGRTRFRRRVPVAFTRN